MVCAATWQLAGAEATWTTDLPAAKTAAKKDNKLVLIDFTGSDWCGFCIKMHKDVFSTPEFQNYAKTNLVLVEIDFPSRKAQKPALKKANAELKQKFAIKGFPTYIVLDGDGKQLWEQVGYLPGGPSAFIAKLEEAKKK